MNGKYCFFVRLMKYIGVAVILLLCLQLSGTYKEQEALKCTSCIWHGVKGTNDCFFPISNSYTVTIFFPPILYYILFLPKIKRGTHMGIMIKFRFGFAHNAHH